MAMASDIVAALRPSDDKPHAKGWQERSGANRAGRSLNAGGAVGTKLLVLTHYFASHRGGVEIVAEQLSKALADTGPAEVTWAAGNCTAPPGDFPGCCVPLGCSNFVEERLGIPWPIPSAAALRSLSRLVRQADLVLLHDALYPLNIAAFLFARRFRKRVVVVQHIGRVPYRNPILNAAMQVANRIIAVPMLSNADQVVFISELTAKYFTSRCTFRRPPQLIFNGISEGMVDAARRAANRERQGDSRTVAFVGRFVEKKGLAVIEKIARELPDVRFELAGWGAMRPEDWGLENVRVHRDLGNVEVCAIYHDADLLVLPSIGEGLPLVVQEALCCGLNVLCGDELLVADPWLEGRVAVAPVDLADADGTAVIWAARVRELLSDGSAPTPVDAVAAAERYGWQQAARAYWAVFDELLKPAAQLAP